MDVHNPQAHQPYINTMTSHPSVWVKLFIGENDTGASVFGIYEFNGIVDGLKNAVKETAQRMLNHCGAFQLAIYPPETKVPFLSTNCMGPGDAVPTDTTSDSPLIVVAPARLQQENGEKCFRFDYSIRPSLMYTSRYFRLSFLLLIGNSLKKRNTPARLQQENGEKCFRFDYSIRPSLMYTSRYFRLSFLLFIGNSLKKRNKGIDRLVNPTKVRTMKFWPRWNS